MSLYIDTVFRLLDLLRGRRNIERLKFLRKSQYWSREKLEKWQLTKLNELLINAKNKSSFYQEHLINVKLPLTNLKQFQEIPILTKNDIRNDREGIKCSHTPEKLFILGKTGGSTGAPTQYYYDKRGRDWNRGCVYRSQEWSGTFLGEKTVQMTGSHYDETESVKLKWKLVFWLQRYKSMPVAAINDAIFEKYFMEITSFRPTNIWGYSSGIYYFADYIERKHPGADLSFIRAIITSSETLFDYQREKINRVFGGVKVFDHYGSREFYVASECRQHSGYHIHSEVVLVEVVDENNKEKKPGEMGRILVTDLSNLVFPFLRYEIGDVGSMSGENSCPCGITLPKLQKISGRIADVIVLPDRMLTPPNFTILLSDYEGIEEYQIIQKKKDELTLNIIRNDKYKDEYEKYIRHGLSDLAGPSVRININYVDKINVPLSGKRRYVISEIEKTL